MNKDKLFDDVLADQHRFGPCDDERAGFLLHSLECPYLIGQLDLARDTKMLEPFVGELVRNRHHHTKIGRGCSTKAMRRLQ